MDSHTVNTTYYFITTVQLPPYLWVEAQLTEKLNSAGYLIRQASSSNPQARAAAGRRGRNAEHRIRSSLLLAVPTLVVRPEDKKVEGTGSVLVPTGSRY